MIQQFCICCLYFSSTAVVLWYMIVIFVVLAVVVTLCFILIGRRLIDRSSMQSHVFMLSVYYFNEAISVQLHLYTLKPHISNMLAAVFSSWRYKVSLFCWLITTNYHWLVLIGIDQYWLNLYHRLLIVLVTADGCYYYLSFSCIDQYWLLLKYIGYWWLAYWWSLMIGID